MPYGAKYGGQYDVRRGAVYGPSSKALSAVSRDATSNILVPANAAEWAQVLASAGISSGGPSALWLFQEASGNPADSVGSFTLTASGTPTYQAAVSGWTRKAITFADAATGR